MNYFQAREREKREEEERAAREIAESERREKEEAREAAEREAELVKLREAKGLSLGPEPEKGPDVTQVFIIPFHSFSFVNGMESAIHFVNYYGLGIGEITKWREEGKEV